MAVNKLIINKLVSNGSPYINIFLPFINIPANGFRYFIRTAFPVKVVRSKNMPEPQNNNVFNTNQILSISLRYMLTVAEYQLSC